MDKDILLKAKQLDDDIGAMSRIIDKTKRGQWIYISTPSNEEFFSKNFQKEFVDWLENKKEEYEKELEKL